MLNTLDFSNNLNILLNKKIIILSDYKFYQTHATQKSTNHLNLETLFVATSLKTINIVKVEKNMIK